LRFHCIQPPVTNEPADISAILEEKDGNCDLPITDNSTTTEVSCVDGGDTSSQKDDSSATSAA